jgi:hypothetical protein
MIGWELDLALDPNHELVRLVTKIPWDDLTQEFGRLYVPDLGRPGIPISEREMPLLSASGSSDPRGSGWSEALRGTKGRARPSPPHGGKSELPAQEACK